jgi:hypothetical protein
MDEICNLCIITDLRITMPAMSSSQLKRPNLGKESTPKPLQNGANPGFLAA